MSLDLWTTEPQSTLPKPAERRSSLSPKLAQQTYHDVNRIFTSFRLLTQGLGEIGHVGPWWARFISEPLPKCEEVLQQLMNQLSQERIAPFTLELFGKWATTCSSCTNSAKKNAGRCRC